MNKLICIALIVAVCVCGLRADDPPIPGYECPLADIRKGCKAATACTYQNDKDCATYVKCNEGGYAYLRPCSPGLLWNDNLKVCDWPAKTTCHQ